MHYQPGALPDHLVGDPFKAIVAPRPIGWISTLDAAGRLNLAPYSFFNAVSSDPPIVLFASEGEKDTARAATETGEFVANLATRPFAEAMNATSAPLAPGRSEFEHAKLPTEASRVVRPPRVAGVAAALECRVVEVIRLDTALGRTAGSIVVFGEVVGVYLDDRFIQDGRFRIDEARTIARCGYSEYAEVREVFRMRRPTAP